MKQRLHQLYEYSGVVLPHVTWIAGAVIVVDLMTRQQWVQNIQQEPTISIGIMGLVLLTTGRELVKYRKKYRREKRAREELETKVNCL